MNIYFTLQLLPYAQRWSPGEAVPWVLCSVFELLTTRKTPRPWIVSRQGQWSWWRDWETRQMRSSWGMWDCLVWRRGWVETSSHSPAAWQKAAAKRVSISFPRWLVIRCEEMASGCTKENQARDQEEYLHREGGQALEVAPHGVPMPGSI